jgi:hypothetical protein
MRGESWVAWAALFVGLANSAYLYGQHRADRRARRALDPTIDHLPHYRGFGREGRW